MKQREAEHRAVAADESKMKRGWLVEGDWYVVVTVGPVYWGRLDYWDEGHYALSECSWIPDTGRTSEFVVNPNVCAEAEYIGDVLVERTSVQSLYRSAATGAVKTK